MDKFIADAINNYISSMIDEATKMFTMFLAYISSTASWALDMPIVKNGIALAQMICLGILAVKVAYEAIMIYILRSSGEAEANPRQLLMGTIKAAAIITCVPWLIDWVFQWGTTLTADVSKLPGTTTVHSSNAFSATVKLAQNAQYFPLFLAVTVVFAVILMIVIFAQSYLRAGELIITAVVGSFMALGLTNNSSSFAEWLKELIAICVTQAAQMFLIQVSFGALKAVTYKDPLLSLCLFIAMLFVTIKVPSIMKQFAHSTGFGRAAGSIGQTAGATIIQNMIAQRMGK